MVQVFGKGQVGDASACDRRRFQRRNRLLIWLCSLAIALPLRAQQTPEIDLTTLVGQKVDVHVTNGKFYADYLVTKVGTSATTGAIKSLSVQPPDSKRTQSFGGSLIQELYLGGQPLDVSYDRTQGCLLHDPAKRQQRLAEEARISQQLSASRNHLWSQVTSEQQVRHLAEHKEYLESVGKNMQLPMQLLETKYYLFYTDMPLNTVNVYVQYLDDMYDQMCRAFGVPEGKNIWLGKCVVVAFQNREGFYRYERTMWNNETPERAQGICHHDSTGRVVMSCFRGDNPVYFATVLVHETSHGFVHRYLSTTHVPPWIDEGIADWVAGTVVKADTAVRDRQKEGLDRIRQIGSLGGQFYDDRTRLEPWQYGIASSLVEMLTRQDSKKYKLLIDGVKEGLTSEQALQRAYGLGFVQLTSRLGTLAGVPALKP